MNLKSGDKVIYYKRDLRHPADDTKLKIGKVYTIHEIAGGFRPVLVVKELSGYNYYADCFKLAKLRKLKVKLP